MVKFESLMINVVFVCVILSLMFETCTVDSTYVCVCVVGKTLLLTRRNCSSSVRVVKVDACTYYFLGVRCMYSVVSGT